MSNYDISESIIEIRKQQYFAEKNVRDSFQAVSEKQSMLMEHTECSFEELCENFPEYFMEADNVLPQEFSHMKFDNTKIMNAIRLFNEGAQRLGTDKNGKTIDINLLTFFGSNEFKKGIQELNEQFDCKIHISRLLGILITTSTIPPLYTKKKITFSKSKGFQMGGVNILINEGPEQTNYMPRDRKQFGTAICSIILHEIFHNISRVMFLRSNILVGTTTAAVQAAMGTKDAKTRRLILTKYVEDVAAAGDNKISDKKARSLVKKLLFATTIGSVFKTNKKSKPDDIAQDGPETDMSEKDTNRMIKLMKSDALKAKVTNMFDTVKLILMIVSGTMTFNFFPVAVALKQLSNKRKYNAKDYRNYEEFYCDLFAAMYGLPPVFKFYTQKWFKIKSTTTAALDDEQIQKVKQYQREITKALKDPHPSEIERMALAAKIAENTLQNSTDLEPEIKSYLEWILRNFGKGKDTILEDSSNKLFDKNITDNLDKHIQNLITKHDITVTEADLSFIFDDSDGEELVSIMEFMDIMHEYEYSE